MRFVAFVAFLTVVVAMPRLAPAWNATGHKTVALIAWRQLDEGERRQVTDILKAHPHYELLLLAARPDDVPADEWAFLRASIWSDLVRPAEPGTRELLKSPQVTRYHRAYWHSIDLPWIPPAERRKFDASSIPPLREEHALTALRDNFAILANRDSSAHDRAVALTWLSHVVGDIHQPLHACTAYSSSFPTGDRVATQVAVRTNDQVVTLHRFWDGIFGLSDSYVTLDFLARLITDDPQLAPEALAEVAGETEYDAWARESYDYAVAVAHLNGRLRTARMAAYRAKELPLEQVPPVPPSYEGNARELSKLRVAQAGYRLAHQIRAALSK